MSKIAIRAEYHDKIWYSVIGEENCPFCNPEETKNTLVETFDYWKIILNKYPYSGQENHLMAVPIRHVQFVEEISDEEFAELPKIHKFMKEFYKEAGEKDYFSATRETMGNRSIEHYHMHFIPGRLQGKFLRCMLQNQGFPIEAEVKIHKENKLLWKNI